MTFAQLYAAAFVIVGYAVIFIMSVVLHEVAHGYVAFRCGDPTAYRAGRLTLNPLRHIDLFMSVLMPVMCVMAGMPMFGGAKPVPVNPYHFKHLVRDDRLVSMAGVAVNFLIAALLAGVLHLVLRLKLVPVDSPHTVVLGMGILTNVVLFAFNLTPIPPLDGSRVLRSFLPWSVRDIFDRLDRFGLVIVLAVVMFVPGFSQLLWTVIDFIWEHVLRLDQEVFWEVVDGFRSVLRRG